MTHTNKTILIVAAFLAVILAVPAMASAQQNPLFPIPGICSDAPWPIGEPAGMTCTGDGTINISEFQAMTGCFSPYDLLRPDLDTLNKMCQMKFGHDAYAAETTVHACCHGTCGNAFYNRGWNCAQVAPGQVSVTGGILCATGCSAEPVCTHDSYKQCYDGDVYWYDSCGHRGDRATDCTTGQTCANASCNGPVPVLTKAFGHVDGVTNGTVTGWACDLNDAEAPLRVDFYADHDAANPAALLGATSADLAGDPAIAAQCGGVPAHRFAFDLPPFLDDGHTHTIFVYAINLSPAEGPNPLIGTGPYQNTPTPVCTGNSYKQCYGGDVYWYDSCGHRGDRATDCTTGQTCANASCSNGAVVQAIGDVYGVTNGNITGWACDPNDFNQSLRVDFYTDPTFTHEIGATSANLAGNSEITSECGGSTSHKFSFQLPAALNDGNPHTIYAYAINLSPAEGPNPLIGSAPYQSIVTPVCTDESYKQCYGGDVYWYDSCGKRGSIANDCTTGQTCQNTSSTVATCNGSCTGNAYQQCSGNYLYWYDACGSQTGNGVYCPNGCSNGSCQNNNCGGAQYQRCNGNYLAWYDNCNNQIGQGTYCSNGCYNNQCQNNYNASVQSNPATNVYNNQATLNGYLYNYGSSYGANYVWFQWGQSTSYGYETPHQMQNYSGAFSQNITGLYAGNTYHFRAVAQLANGQTVYGNDTLVYPSNNNYGNLLTVNKTARNLTTGAMVWSNNVTARPSDVLMFMITVQATGNQTVNNVMVRDYFPQNLIYKNQLVVSGTTYNYGSGDITQGINIGTINAGQTITITYQAQLASAANFAYGTSTLTNSVSATSSQSGYSPTSNATISVVRSGVYGATTIDTGLTNNFWADSFFLPLALALLAFFAYRGGLFAGVEKWAFAKKQGYQAFRSEKELQAKINKIKNLES